MPETYNAITETECLPTKPCKTSLFLRFRANLLAALEGSTTAPKVQAQAIDCVAFDVTGGTFTCPDGTQLGFIDYVCHAEGTSSGSGTTVFRYRTSDDAGSTWSTWSTLVSLTAGSSGVDAEDRNFGIATLPAGTNAIQCALSGSGFSTTDFQILLRAYGGTAV